MRERDAKNINKRGVMLHLLQCSSTSKNKKVKQIIMKYFSKTRTIEDKSNQRQIIEQLQKQTELLEKILEQLQKTEKLH